MSKKFVVSPTRSRKEKLPFLESPSGVQTHVVNEAFGFGYLNSQFDVVFTTIQLHPGPDGELHSHNLIAARLRFDLDTARALRDRLDRAIESVVTPPRRRMN